MDKEVKAYFEEQYAKSKVTVVPGHWPDFESKEAVDNWIAFQEIVASNFKTYFSPDFVDEDEDDIF